MTGVPAAPGTALPSYLGCAASALHPHFLGRDGALLGADADRTGKPQVYASLRGAASC
jgi:hypothetical protein